MSNLDGSLNPNKSDKILSFDDSGDTYDKRFELLLRKFREYNGEDELLCKTLTEMLIEEEIDLKRFQNDIAFICEKLVDFKEKGKDWAIKLVDKIRKEIEGNEEVQNKFNVLYEKITIREDFLHAKISLSMNLLYGELLHEIREQDEMKEPACQALLKMIINNEKVFNVKEPDPYYIIETLIDFADEGKSWAVELIEKIDNKELQGENAQNIYQVRDTLYMAQDDPEISYLLGNIYSGWDNDRAIRWYQNAAKHGSFLARRELEECFGFIVDLDKYGKQIFNSSEKKRMFVHRKRDALHQDAQATYEVAQCYNYGLGVDCNRKYAFDYYQKAAELENPKATYEVSQSYYYGFGVSKDKKLAFEYCKKAAEMGHPGAKFCLAKYYISGEVVDKNDELAFQNIREAAELGHREALFELAHRHQVGIGVDKNEDLALVYYKKALEQEDVQAEDLPESLKKYHPELIEEYIY